jgi:DNA-3-methyladenine glycosylase I
MSEHRCKWATHDPLYTSYHDNEWGVPVYDDQKLFEFLVLESAQAGLSWLTILKRREGYRRVFHDFDVQKVACMSEDDRAVALLDTGIIRNKLKVRAAVENAKVFILIQKEFTSFSNYLWSYVDGQPIVNKWSASELTPVTTDVSDAISKDLKKRGMSFVGSTIMYAYMQAVGVVNDHMDECYLKNSKPIKQPL